MQLATGLSFAGAQRASSRFLAGNDTRPAVRRAQEAVAERGVREALQTSRTYVTGLWARLNGQQPPGQSALPFGMLPPVSNAGAPPGPRSATLRSSRRAPSTHTRARRVQRRAGSTWRRCSCG